MKNQPSAHFIYFHNPRCSKSRNGLVFLESHGLFPTLKNVLNDGIDAEEVVELVKALDMHPSECIRKNEPAFHQLESDEFSIEEWSDIIHRNPILLERPILWDIKRNVAVIGRPPSNFLTLL